jgi:head-tail adaptor
MQTGQLDQRISFKRNTVASIGTIGEDIAGPVLTVATVWANVAYLQGRELEVAAQRWAEARYKITIRRQPGLTLRPTDYISWNSQTLDMIDIQGLGTRDDFWIFYAKDHIETAEEAAAGGGLTWDQATGTWDETTQTWDAI